jgi:hypothetical protein
MAFTDVITGRDIWGKSAVTFGTYESSGGDAGGNIDTGLHMCEFIKLTPKAAAVSASEPVVNTPYRGKRGYYRHYCQ